MDESNIKLPDKVIDDLGLHRNDKLIVKVDDGKITIEKKEDVQKGQTLSLRWFLVPSLIASIAFFITVFYQKISKVFLAGNDWITIANATIGLGLITGIISFTTILVLGKRRGLKNYRAIYWRNFPSLILSFTLTMGIVLLGIFWILGFIFEGANFDIYTSTVLVFIFTSVVNYIMIYFATTLTTSRIITLFTVVIIGGVILAMASNSNLQWWKYSFSFLGSNKAYASWQFNLTLVVASLLMLALIDYLFVNIEKLRPHNTGLLILRVLLTLTDICLACVGLFPSTEYKAFHDNVAMALVYLAIIIIVGLRWMIPGVTKEFVWFSYSIGIFLGIANFLFKNVGYLSLTGFELISFVLAFSWILLLLQNLQRLSVVEPKIYNVVLD